MFLGSAFAMGNGACMPIFAWLCGDMLNSFSEASSMVQESLDMFVLFIEIGIGVFGSGWIMIACWLITGERQSIRCRK
jgi:ATP-binding cassette subfamily B (MDR/TAP) protein 1